jgi:hypothetical protein
VGNNHALSWLPGVAKTTSEGGNEPDAAKRQLNLDGGAKASTLWMADRSPIDPAPPLDKWMKVDDTS